MQVVVKCRARTPLFARPARASCGALSYSTYIALTFMWELPRSVLLVLVQRPTAALHCARTQKVAEDVRVQVLDLSLFFLVAALVYTEQQHVAALKPVSCWTALGEAVVPTACKEKGNSGESVR